MIARAIRGVAEQFGVYVAANNLRTELAFSVFGVPFLVRTYRPTRNGPLTEH
ncbi:hypothetical protein [Streptomyces sp. SAI-129]|uniref:hypothetical protein n=1 Tax=Streptomyces sp. SAI-129 TaxID=3377727 RepID=UPI003C7A759F